MESRKRIQLNLSNAKSDLFTAIPRENCYHAFPLWNRYLGVCKAAGHDRSKNP